MRMCHCCRRARPNEGAVARRGAARPRHEGADRGRAEPERAGDVPLHRFPTRHGQQADAVVRRRRVCVAGARWGAVAAYSSSCQLRPLRHRGGAGARAAGGHRGVWQGGPGRWREWPRSPVLAAPRRARGRAGREPKQPRVHRAALGGAHHGHPEADAGRWHRRGGRVMDIGDFVQWAIGSSTLMAGASWAFRQTVTALTALSNARAAKVAADAAKVAAEAAQDVAGAKAFEDALERVDKLEARVEELERELETERDARGHWESQVHVLQQQLDAEKRARGAAEDRESVLAREMTELRLAIHGSHQTLPTPLLPKPFPSGDGSSGVRG